jgi:hypothetical protein
VINGNSGLTKGWIKGVFELGLITIGVWHPNTVDSFRVLRRAADFDNDEDDDDRFETLFWLLCNAFFGAHFFTVCLFACSRQQDVMTLLGRSRGLIWLPIPIGVVMTKVGPYFDAALFICCVQPLTNTTHFLWLKVAEALNDPPYFIINEANTKLDLFMPVGKRRLLYLISGLKLLVWNRVMTSRRS